MVHLIFYLILSILPLHTTDFLIGNLSYHKPIVYLFIYLFCYKEGHNNGTPGAPYRQSWISVISEFSPSGSYCFTFSFCFCFFDPVYGKEKTSVFPPGLTLLQNAGKSENTSRALLGSSGTCCVLPGETFSVRCPGHQTEQRLTGSCGIPRWVTGTLAGEGGPELCRTLRWIDQRGFPVLAPADERAAGGGQWADPRSFSSLHGSDWGWVGRHVWSPGLPVPQSKSCQFKFVLLFIHPSMSIDLPFHPHTCLSIRPVGTASYLSIHS